MSAELLKIVLHEQFNLALSNVMYTYELKIFNNLTLDDEDQHPDPPCVLWKKLINTPGNCVEVALRDVVKTFDRWDSLYSSSMAEESIRTIIRSLHDVQRYFGSIEFNLEQELLLACRSLVRAAVSNTHIARFIDKPVERSRSVKIAITDILELLRKVNPSINHSDDNEELV